MSIPRSGLVEIMPPEDVAKLLPPAESDRYTSLYRLYDKSGVLLYVGVAQSLLTRMNQHRLNARWFRDVVRVDVQHFDHRGDALAAETEAIETEKPKYNVVDTGRTYAWDGSRLKKARERAGLTQVELAKRLGGSPTTVAKYEQNKAQPSIPALVRLSNLLRVSSDVLLGLVPDDAMDHEPLPGLDFPPAESLGQAMRDARRQQGLMTRAHLAEKTGIKLRKIDFFERGVYLPSESELATIARALDVDLEWLRAASALDAGDGTDQ